MPDRFITRQIAALAGLEHRTIERYYAGPSRVHPGSRALIRQALASLGLPDPHAHSLPTPRLVSGTARTVQP